VTDAPPPTLRLRVDTDALAANWRALDAMSGSAQAGAAVKADCYGLGVERCVLALHQAGARNFFVAHWSEVAGVAAHVDPRSISVLHGLMHEDDAHYARAVGARPVINSLQQARLWRDSGGGPCDAMVDSGINRLGVAMADVGEPLLQQLEIVTLMSHLANADEDSAMNARQLLAFQQAKEVIPHQRLSLANSAGIALGGDFTFDLTRPGLSLYGGIPRGELRGVIRQVAFPQAAIMQIRQLSAGDRVGYNGEFTAERAMRAGVISLGYADGFLRSWGAMGALEHRGRALPLLGKVSMDMVVVDLTRAPELGEGDWLDVPYYLPEAAAISGLSQYELLTVLGQRFAR